jgi:hypothetical protein
MNIEIPSWLDKVPACSESIFRLRDGEPEGNYVSGSPVRFRFAKYSYWRIFFTCLIKSRSAKPRRTRKAPHRSCLHNFWILCSSS